jgi:hypothetical protein
MEGERHRHEQRAFMGASSRDGKKEETPGRPNLPR